MSLADKILSKCEVDTVNEGIDYKKIMAEIKPMTNKLDANSNGRLQDLLGDKYDDLIDFLDNLSLETYTKIEKFVKKL